MTFTDSMFLFEIVVDNLKSYELSSKEFRIDGRFANLFEFNIYPGDSVPLQANQKSKSGKAKVRKTNYSKVVACEKGNFHCRQFILCADNAQKITSNMKKHDFELSVWSKNNPKYKIGSIKIPWSKSYLDYLSNLNDEQAAPVVKGIYNIFNEITLKPVTTFTLSMKLMALDEKLISQFKYLPEFNSNSLLHNSTDAKQLSVLNKSKNINDNHLGSHKVVETIYKHGSKARAINQNLKNYAEFKDSQNKAIRLSGNHIKYSKSGSVIINNNEQTSFTSIPKSELKKKFNTFDYIFGDPNGSSNTKNVYSVYYFTVDVDKSNSTSKNTSKTSQGTKPSTHSSEQSNRIRLQKCRSECSNKTNACKNVVGSSLSELLLRLPQDIGDLINVSECNEVRCESKVHRNLPDPPDDAILLNLTNIESKCCVNLSQKIEEVIGGVSAEMRIGDDPCYCTCECRFGFTKKTTYCGVCGGYELAGDELVRKPAHEMPYPCPIFHKLVDKNKLKTLSTSGSESKKKDKTGSSQRAGVPDKRSTDKKSIESEKDPKKNKKTKKDDKFKFNYGYKAPQIGHSKCALPCTGTLRNVPKHMGWLWTEDSPGLKFRPLWKPGAANKHVVRLLKMAKNPEECYAKKRRRDAAKKKRPLKRPLLIVHKKDGEFKVTMETMKTFTKPRAINQHPYEDKPVVTYTIGRTEEENRDRRKKKERAQRRLERAQRHFIQDTFKDVCKEICLKTYQQALGILPEAEDPPCMCYPALPTAENINFNVSCSCSEDSSSIGSDTDSDEWIVEFTPPNALFDPSFNGKKILKSDNSSQYTYLDYQVKLFDSSGNPVPRFFNGPDGKQQCSDLGGFWSPEHKWLEINVDGFIAPDGKWAPNTFIGPCGEQVDAETGKFQASNGEWLVVGVDGYVDSQGKWRFYKKKRGRAMQNKHCESGDGKRNATGYRRDEKLALRSEGSWSCFGDASPRQLSKLGIIGHGQDKKMLEVILKEMLARGEDVKIPESATVFRLNKKSGKKSKTNAVRNTFKSFYKEQTKCHHPLPSKKGIIAVDAEGNKTYFKLRDYKNERPHQRLTDLSSQGISVSSFHVPCFSSFINSEIMKQQQRERLIRLAAKNTATL